MKQVIFFLFLNSCYSGIKAQVKWINIDSAYQPLPKTVHIYKSTDSLDGKPNIMYYAVADLKNQNLEFTSDTTMHRRITPSAYYKKNNQPVLVVNGSFFSFATNANYNVVLKDGDILGYNRQSIASKKDSSIYFHQFYGAIGISKNRNADVAWIYSNPGKKFLYASQEPVPFFKNDAKEINVRKLNRKMPSTVHFSKWRMKTAIGGGPVLLQDGEIKITNDEERRFGGKAINDHHPRTAIGYTKDNKLIVLVSEGRSKDAAGLNLIQLATILKNLGCEEALNLDGGGSSCMLINGKQTNKPSSKGVQRQVPSVFIIKKK